MPNGFYGTREEWDDLESPLARIDSALEKYAQEHGLAISKNTRNWPQRGLGWVGDDGIEKHLSLFLKDEGGRTFDLIIAASQLRNNGWHTRGEKIFSDLPAEKLQSDFVLASFEEAVRKLKTWTARDLKRVKG